MDEQLGVLLATVAPFTGLAGVWLGWKLNLQAQVEDRHKQSEIDAILSAMRSLQATVLRFEELMTLRLVGGLAGDKAEQARLDASKAVTELGIASELVADGDLRKRLGVLSRQVMTRDMRMMFESPSGDPDEWGEQFANRTMEMMTSYNDLMRDLGNELRRLRRT